jgi:hypothetical protein
MTMLLETGHSGARVAAELAGEMEHGRARPHWRRCRTAGPEGRTREGGPGSSRNRRGGGRSRQISTAMAGYLPGGGRGRETSLALSPVVPGSNLLEEVIVETMKLCSIHRSQDVNNGGTFS